MLPVGEVPQEAARFFLADCAFNRGNKGAATILQLALMSSGLLVGKADGHVGPKTRAALRGVRDSREFLQHLLLARQHYEIKKGRDETSKFWAGLSARWLRAYELALDKM